MKIIKNAARQLCNANEWALVEKSFSPLIEKLTPANLKSKIVRSRTLRQKYTDLGRRQHLKSQTRRSGMPGEQLNARTRRKAVLFAETLQRFEGRLKRVEADARGKEPAMKKTAAKKKQKAARKTLNTAAVEQRLDRETRSRKSRERALLGKRKQTQVEKMGQKGIQSHIASTTRRNQARRDSRGRRP